MKQRKNIRHLSQRLQQLCIIIHYYKYHTITIFFLRFHFIFFPFNLVSFVKAFSTKIHGTFYSFSLSKVYQSLTMPIILPHKTSLLIHVFVGLKEGFQFPLFKVLTITMNQFTNLFNIFMVKSKKMAIAYFLHFKLYISKSPQLQLIYLIFGKNKFNCQHLSFLNLFL